MGKGQALAPLTEGRDFSYLFRNDIAEREIMASAMIEAKAIGQPSAAQRSEAGHQP